MTSAIHKRLKKNLTEVNSWLRIRVFFKSKKTNVMFVSAGTRM